MEAVLALGQKALEILTSVEGMSGLVLVVEFVLRLVPSDKPKSILLAIASVLGLVGAVLTKASEVLNKLIPQKLK